MVTAIRIDEIKNKIFYELRLDKMFNIPYLNTVGNMDTGFFIRTEVIIFFMIQGYSNYRNNVCVDCLTVKNIV